MLIINWEGRLQTARLLVRTLGKKVTKCIFITYRMKRYQIIYVTAFFIFLINNIRSSRQKIQVEFGVF